MDVGNECIGTSQLLPLFDTIIAPFLLPGETPMQRFELFEVGAQGFGIGNTALIRALRQRFDPHIDPNGCSGGGWWIGNLLSQRILFMQRNSGIDNEAILANEKSDKTASQQFADKVRTTLIGDVAAVCDFSQTDPCAVWQ